jgi:hypothetical protein
MAERPASRCPTIIQKSRAVLDDPDELRDAFAFSFPELRPQVTNASGTDDDTRDITLISRLHAGHHMAVICQMVHCRCVKQISLAFFMVVAYQPAGCVEHVNSSPCNRPIVIRDEIPGRNQVGRIRAESHHNDTIRRHSSR